MATKKFGKTVTGWQESQMLGAAADYQLRVLQRRHPGNIDIETMLTFLDRFRKSVASTLEELAKNPAPAADPAE